jgi:hypothetical protein
MSTSPTTLSCEGKFSVGKDFGLSRVGVFVPKSTEDHKPRCSSLDLKCPPEVYVLKAWSHPVALLGGGGTLRRWGPVEVG